MHILHCLLTLAILLWTTPSWSAGSIAPGGGPVGGLPAIGNEGDCLLVTSGVPAWGACPGAGSGAPTTATYITQTANGTLSAEQALATLATGIMKVTTTTGVVSVAVKGTDYPGLDFANVFTKAQAIQSDSDAISLTVRRNGAAQTAKILEIQSEVNATLASIDKTGAIIAPSFTGDVTGAVTGNASTATALAANGSNCSAGQFPLGVDASGAVESCTALPTTIAGTANEVAASASTGAVTLSLPSTVNLASKTLRVPSSTTLPATCAVGDVYMDTDATTGQRFYACESTNTWVVQGVGGSGAPTDATYLMQTANGSTSAEQAIGALATGCMSSTTTTGVVATRTLTGTANQITVTNGDCSGTPTFSIPTNPTLPGTVSATAFTATGAASGIVDINGVTSGKLRLTTADATAQTVTVTAAAQTVGATTLTIPDRAGSNGTFAFVAGDIGAATATTPAANDNDTSVATTAYVQTELTAYASDTVSFTNKSYDTEGTGNVFTYKKYKYIPGAGCNNATAGSVWDLPTSSPAVAACRTGTNTQKGTLDFADGASLTAQYHEMLSEDWTGAIDAIVTWQSSTTTGNVVWQLAIACAGDGESDDPAFTDDVFTADTAKGTGNQYNMTASNTITTTGTCAASKIMHVRLKRDSAHASDSMAGTARAVGVMLKLREAQ